MSPATSIEQTLLTVEQIKQGIRLACQAQNNGKSDLIVKTQPKSRIGQRWLLIDGASDPITIHPAVYALLLKVPPITPNQPLPDDERLIIELNLIHKQPRPIEWKVPLPVQHSLPSVLRNPSERVTVVIHGYRKEAARLAIRIQHLDLAPHPRFNQTYASSLFIPQMD